MDGDNILGNANLSLKEKFNLVYAKKEKLLQEKAKKIYKSHTPKCLIKIGQYLVDNPEVLDKIGQSCYIFGLSGIVIWGTLIAIPFLYSDISVWYASSAQIFATLCVVQVMVNWICIKLVKSNYIPAIHGAMPNSLKVGDHISKLDIPNNLEHSVMISPEDSQPLEKRNRIYVATEMPRSGSEPPKRTEFPYWSWSPCLRCNRPRPPRCQHCSICNVCILKRDHHCFLTGTCVGFKNLRHFTVFVFWAAAGATFGTCHMLFFIYYYIQTEPNVGYSDLILPWTCIRAIFGFVSWREILLVTLAYILVFFNIWSIYFLMDLIDWIKSGATSFEKMSKIKVYDNRTLRDKLRAVFGHYWLLNFVVPLHFLFPPVEDPINWPDVKA